YARYVAHRYLHSFPTRRSSDLLELLRDRRAEFEEAGVRTFGISRDSPWTHIAWMQALDLDVGLLSDWNGEAVRGFDVTQDYRGRSEEHTSELQSRENLVCRLLL